jgi:cellulose synthase/poly-beta-1,6-N-acetylglucosamine synthase-like glycosyltransferase
MQVRYEKSDAHAAVRRDESFRLRASEARAPGAGTPVAPRSAFCVTLYNEDCESFRATMVALLESLMQSNRERGDRAPSAICVIADGREKIDRRLLDLLHGIGVLRDDTATTRDEVESHVSRHRVDDLLDLFSLAARKQARRTFVDPTEVVLTVLAKKHNRGKLHSHYLFFDRFCREVRPTYCFQIDVGTVLEPSAVSSLIRKMEQEPALAAVAPRILPAVPAAEEGLLAEWQYLDFAHRKAVSWPFEVSTRFLSVIPGQAGIFRWDALAGSSRDHGDPLCAYFRGLQASSPLERIMFLAEDRVIGAAVMLSNSKQWQLGYLPEAAATTDSCRSFGELFRQRRRWTNSSLACRVWLLSQCRGFLAREDRGAGAKCGFATSMIAQLLLAAREFFAPAQLIALLFVFAAVMAPAASPVTAFLQQAFWCALVAELWFTAFARPEEPDTRGRSLFGAARNAVGIITGGLYVGILYMQLPPMAFAILVSPALALLAMSFVLPARAMPAALRSYLFPFTSLAMFSSLLGYAMWKLDDVSWGTKGLTASPQLPEARRQSARLRNVVLGAFVLANGALAWCAATLPGFTSASLNVVTETACLLEAAFVAVALLFMAGGAARKLTTAKDAGDGAGTVSAARILNDGKPGRLVDAALQPWHAESRDLKEPLFVDRGPVRGSHDLGRVKDHTLS